MQEKAEEAGSLSQGTQKASENVGGRTWAYPRLAPSCRERGAAPASALVTGTCCTGDMGALSQHFDQITLPDFMTVCQY